MQSKVSLLEHFRKLAAFRGREDRASFWPYAALAFVILSLAQTAMVIPFMARWMRAAQDFRHMDEPKVTVADNDYSIDLNEFSNPPATAVSGEMPSPGFIATIVAVTIGLAILLYAAAVVRRLHDRGKSGAWGLLPLPFLLYLAIQMPQMFDQPATGDQPGTGLVVSLLIANLLYMAALVALIVLLAGKGEAGPNRYDPPA